MRTKTIFKTVALAMMMPAMLLTSACSSEDDFVNNNENNIKQGYTLPVTINVTREGDATTRATYNESTGKLTFSAGDKLFVSGNETTAGKFAGTLTWQSGGTFSGTLTTQNEFTGTADALFTDANSVSAILLPAGYNNYDFLTLKTNNGYDATISTDHSKTFALTKAAAVEQFSLERTFSYSNGFSLYPSCGILNFTITGLTPNTDVNVNFSDYTPNGNTMVGTVHTDGSGNATFAVAVYAYSSKNIQTCSLYVNGNPIALVNSSKPIDAGKIYNITRSAGPTYPSISTVTTSDYGKVVCAAGHLHDANTPVPSGCTGVGVIAKVTDGGHGLIMSLQDAEENCWTNIQWCTSVTYAGSTMKRLDEWMFDDCLPSYTSLGSIAVSNWCVASMDDYIAMFQNLGSQSSAVPKSYDNYVNAKITSAGGTALNDGDYWGYLCATEGWSFYYYSWDGDSERNDPDYDKYVRPVLGF